MIAAWMLVLLNLSDDFAPPVLAGAPYRDTYVALAQEKGDERDLELHGVSPAFTVLARRLLDEKRHICHDALPPVALPRSLAVRPDDETPADQKDDPLRQELIRTVQSHFACDGLFPAKRIDGRFGGRTEEALELFRRRNMIPSGRYIDGEVASLFWMGSRELDYRAVLRALRERVVHATGIVEDGSAALTFGKVIGRQIDGRAFRKGHGHLPLPNGAPDYISPATDAAARALGWTSPARTAVYFGTRSADELSKLRVVLTLPVPSYHSPAMQLRAEIDRGDVWYDYAFNAAGERVWQPVGRRPMLTLFATISGAEIALFRWPTTIGGWQKEELATGGLVRRYKPSKPGKYFWTEVVGAPAWYPPPSTPDEELVRREDGRWVVRAEKLGPGYRSAYGLALIVHRTARGVDDAVRTHGTANYGSVFRADSHGCHRLSNHLVLRLATFLLAHRPHRTDGNIAQEYERVIRWKGTHRLVQKTRGYRFTLTEPIAVDVLEGKVKGKRKTPHLRSFWVPEAG